MDELHTGPRHPLSGTDPESYFDFHVVPLDTLCYDIYITHSYIFMYLLSN